MKRQISPSELELIYSISLWSKQLKFCNATVGFCQVFMMRAYNSRLSCLFRSSLEFPFDECKRSWNFIWEIKILRAVRQPFQIRQDLSRGLQLSHFYSGILKEGQWGFLFHRFEYVRFMTSSLVENGRSAFLKYSGAYRDRRSMRWACTVQKKWMLSFSIRCSYRSADVRFSAVDTFHSVNTKCNTWVLHFWCSALPNRAVASEVNNSII